MSFTAPILDFFTGFPHWLSTVLIAMLPIFELRGSLPVALGSFDMQLWKAFILSEIGNMIPIPFILLLLKRVVKIGERFPPLKRILDYFFERTRKKTGPKIKRYEALALVFFVAIPLPITGAWTGALAAWLFDIEFKKAICYIFLGVLIAGVVVSAVWYGARELLRTSVWAFTATVFFLLLLYLGYRYLVSRNNSRDEKKTEDQIV